MEHEVSCYCSSLLIEYAMKRNFAMDVLFDNIEGYSDTLKNRHEWTTMDTMIVFMRNFESTGGDLYKAGIDYTWSGFQYPAVFFKGIPNSGNNKTDTGFF
jgi:hypothetical protein